MGECIGLFFFVATSLLGIITLLDRLCLSILREQGVGERVVITMCGHVEQAEFWLRRYVFLGVREIVVIDGGMDEQTRKIVARFCEKHGSVTVQTEK